MSPPSDSFISVTLPHIKTKKRRIVSKGKRKNAMFSCDRCKVRKIACQRISPTDEADTESECYQCCKANIKCQTTIQRKRKTQGPIENLGLHYKCLLYLVQGLYPEEDVNNIDCLIALGKKLNIQMPSRYGGSGDEDREITLALTSSIPCQPGIIEKEKESSQHRKDMIKRDSSIMKGYFHLQKDNFIVDQGGITHYIGPLGAPSLLASLVNNMVTIQCQNSNNLWQRFQDMYDKNEIIISSIQEPLKDIDFVDFETDRFPLVNLIPKKEGDYYVDIFFSRIHHNYFCFDESKFRHSYQVFWNIIKAASSEDLSSQQICCIYMVWILGSHFKEYPNCRLTEVLKKKFLKIIKFFLSEMLLTPSLDGIRCMLLLSVYMDSNCRRESGYMLLELATRQASSMGLNRQSISQYSGDVNQIEEIQRTWWTLFQLGLRFSNQMDRLPFINIEEVTAKYPKMTDIDDCDFKSCYIQSIELSKLVYELLQFRRHLNLNKYILENDSLQKAVTLLNKFVEWFNNLDESLKNCDCNVTCYKLHLHMKYYYHFITFTLPFSYELFKNNTLIPNDNSPLIWLTFRGLEAAVKMSSILKALDEYDYFNGTLFNDIFFAYHASMALVAGYLFFCRTPYSYTSSDIEIVSRKYGVMLTDVISAIKIIQDINSKNSLSFKGSLRKVSQWINILFDSLNMFKSGEKDAISIIEIDNFTDIPFCLFHNDIPMPPPLTIDDNFNESLHLDHFTSNCFSVLESENERSEPTVITNSQLAFDNILSILLESNNSNQAINPLTLPGSPLPDIWYGETKNCSV